MSLRDPVAVYNAATNEEARLLCDLLLKVGIEAYLMEDLSVVGAWVGGLVPEIHKPQVWVDRDDVERAVASLEDYERRSAERRGTAPIDERPVEAVCEECGATSQFSPGQRGSVQNCPKCGAYMDVEDEAEEPEQ
jgi:hypothetical protein